MAKPKLFLFALRQEARSFLSRAAWRKHDTLRFYYTHPSQPYHLVITGIGAVESNKRLKLLFDAFPDLIQSDFLNIGTAGEIQPGALTGFKEPGSAPVVSFETAYTYSDKLRPSEDSLVSIGSPEDFKNLAAKTDTRLFVDMEAAFLCEILAGFNAAPAIYKIITDTNTDFSGQAEREQFAGLLPGFSEKLYEFLAPLIGGL